MGRLDYIDGKSRRFDRLSAPHACDQSLRRAGCRLGTSWGEAETMQGFNIRRWTAQGLEFFAVSDINAEELQEFVDKFDAAFRRPAELDAIGKLVLCRSLLGSSRSMSQGQFKSLALFDFVGGMSPELQSPQDWRNKSFTDRSTQNAPFNSRACSAEARTAELSAVIHCPGIAVTHCPGIKAAGE